MNRLQEIKDNSFLHIKSGMVMMTAADRDWLIRKADQVNDYQKTVEMYSRMLTAWEIGYHALESKLKMAKEQIQEMKNKSRFTNYLSMAQENLEFAQKLYEANQEIERLLVVQKAYEAYKTAN